jgi:hypothetical protein
MIRLRILATHGRSATFLEYFHFRTGVEQRRAVLAACRPALYGFWQTTGWEQVWNLQVEMLTDYFVAGHYGILGTSAFYLSTDRSLTMSKFPLHHAEFLIWQGSMDARGLALIPTTYPYFALCIRRDKLTQ